MTACVCVFKLYFFHSQHKHGHAHAHKHALERPHFFPDMLSILVCACLTYKHKQRASVKPSGQQVAISSIPIIPFYSCKRLRLQKHSQWLENNKSWLWRQNLKNKKNDSDDGVEVNCEENESEHGGRLNVLD